jgi:hypothetical protein
LVALTSSNGMLLQGNNAHPARCPGVVTVYRWPTGDPCYLAELDV